MIKSIYIALLAGNFLWMPAANSRETQPCISSGSALPRENALSSAWRAYVCAFITSDGRVVDNANGGISHSEGQGYAMLIAVRANDRMTFGKLWRWTAANLLVRDDGLASWLWDPAAAGVTDKDDASDGNILIAWALAEAAERWGNSDYKVAAKRIADAVLGADTVRTRFGETLLPGSRAFGIGDRPDAPVVNLSYWVFPAFQRLRQISSARKWDALFASGLALIDATQFGPKALPTDWISLAHDAPQPASGFARVFGYDAIRVPLYLAWGRPNDHKLMANFGKILGSAPYQVPSVIEVDTGKSTETFGGDGYRAIAAAVDCILNGAPIPEPVMKLTTDYYYPATLQILSLLAVQDVRPECMPQSK
jgi:endoglucanase